MIYLENISKVIADETILEKINLYIKEGECLVLSGVSGSGKSTLLSIIGTLLKPSDGTLKLDGSNVTFFNDAKLSECRKTTIGFITQSFYLFDTLSVEDNIRTSLVLSSLSQEQIENKVHHIMQVVNIAHKSKSIASKLSGGEKQRCILARTLINEPKIFLCDEPTANLDDENSKIFAEIMKDLKAKGKTIIMTTHDPFIKRLDFVDRIITMKDGKLE